MNKKVRYKVMPREMFHKAAEVWRSLSYSIMSDSDIIKQYNSLSISKRAEIKRQIKTIGTVGKSDVSDIPDGDFLLSVVDIHIVSGRYSVDPAVVCLIGTLDNNKNYSIV